jgi:hypothetical protein
MPRPYKPLDLAQLEKLASLQCTIEEAAAFFGFSKRGLIQRLKKTDARDAWDNGKLKGKISLRRSQFLTASLENADPRSRVTMQIWLGKQILEQRDQIKQEVSGPKEGPVQLEVSAREQLLSKLTRLIAARGTAGGDSKPQ